MKKRVEHEKDNSDRWLLTYSDLITLLMIFFVVMYAISSVDAQKYQVLSESFGEVFNGSSGQASSAGIQVSVSPTDGKTEKVDPALVAAADKIMELIKEKNLQDKVSVSIEERGVVVGLMNTVLFDPGSAQIKPDAVPTLVAIGQIANGVHNYIRVEGNTDDVPQNSAQFPSNWDLASGRSNEVLKLMIGQSGIDPNKISSVSYGEYRPSLPNDSMENRSKNRKVDIVILSDRLDKSESESADISNN
ncbi:MAG TPA: flagellar motor protein MotB [Bacillota bacterium]|nr:flagellar motor protein MotB [Bacillota bacterium]